VIDLVQLLRNVWRTHPHDWHQARIWKAYCQSL